MKTLINILIFGAIIGFLITSSETEINSVVSSSVNILSQIIKFIGEGLLSLAKVI